MKNIKIELTEQQYNNLQVFLNRVDLKGGEVPAFLEVIQALQVKKEGDTNEL